MTQQRTFWLAMMALAACPGPSLADAEKGSRIVVTVSTFRNNLGILGCRLFSSAEGFPEKPPWIAQQRVHVRGPRQTCRFENVSPGVYALAVIHDENENDKLDKNWVGIPKEGYGVSNNHTHALKAPAWEDSQFEVMNEKETLLSIKLRY